MYSPAALRMELERMRREREARFGQGLSAGVGQAVQGVGAAFEAQQAQREAEARAQREAEDRAWRMHLEGSKERRDEGRFQREGTAEDWKRALAERREGRADAKFGFDLDRDKFDRSRLSAEDLRKEAADRRAQRQASWQDIRGQTQRAQPLASQAAEEIAQALKGADDPTARAEALNAYAQRVSEQSGLPAPDAEAAIVSALRELEDREREYALRQRALELRRQGMEEGAAVRQAMLELRTQPRPPKPAELDEITAIDFAIQNIEEIRANKALVNTGPIANLWRAAKAKAGVSDPRDARFQAMVGMQLADYIKSISGATVPEAEMRRLVANMPVFATDDETFIALADNLHAYLKRKRELEVRRFQLSNVRTDGLRSTPSAETTAPKEVTVTDGTETFTIPVEDLPAAQADGFREVR